MRNLLRRILDRLRPNRPTIHAQITRALTCGLCDWRTLGVDPSANNAMATHLQEVHGVTPRQRCHLVSARKLTAMANAAHQRGDETTSTLYRERAQRHSDAADQIDTQAGDTE